jgi:hypothetical protein
MRTNAAISGIAMLVVATAAQASEERLFERLKGLAGPNAVACGTVELRASNTAAFDCARTALSAGKPFWVAVQMHGIDSSLWRAVALEPDKTAWLLYYDSSVSGRRGDQDESLTQSLCSDVQFFPDRIRCPHWVGQADQLLEYRQEEVWK